MSTLLRLAVSARARLAPTPPPATPGVDYLDTVLADSPIAVWPLDVDGRDASGNALPLTTVTATFGSGAGTWGNWLDLNGSTGYAERANPTQFNLSGPLSYEMWVWKPELFAGSDGGGQMIGLDDRVGLRRAGSAQDVAFSLRNDAGVDIGAGSWGQSFSIPSGSWVHVVGVYDRSAQQQRVYVNGALAVEGVTTNEDAATNVTAPFTLGCQYDGPAGTSRRRFFAGRLAWVAVYDSALSAARVADHYDKRGMLAPSAPEPDPEPEVTAAAPEFIDASALTFPDSPMTITEGGTYSGLRIAATGTTTCVTISTSDPVIIEDCDFRFERGNGVAWGANVEVRNCRFFGMHPTTEGHQIGRSIATEATRLVVENCLTQRATFFVDRAKVAGEYVFRYNIGRNIDARRVDSNGEPVSEGVNMPELRQFIQLGRGSDPTVANTGTILVEWNEVWNDPGSGFVEDVINFFGVGGTSGNLAVVRRNLINGAWPTPVTASGYTGGGIMAGDGEGSYILREYNIVLNTTNYGIAIAGGQNSIIRNNRVLRTGFAGDDMTALVDRDVGIYVVDYSSTPSFTGHVVEDNYIAWQMADGSFQNLNIASGAGTESGNALVTSGDITQADIDEEVLSFRTDAASAGVSIGPS